MFQAQKDLQIYFSLSKKICHSLKNTGAAQQQFHQKYSLFQNQNNLNLLNI